MKKPASLRDLITQGILTVICIGFIVYVFPKEAKFKYEFRQGKPWLHETLFAPFDFAIYKSDDEFSDEKEKIKSASKPYFQYDETILDAQLKNYESQFDETWQDSEYSSNGGFFGNIFGKKEKSEGEEKIKENHRLIGQTIINTIFSKGVIKVDDVIEGKLNDFAIVVLKKQVADDRELKQVFTLQTANDFIAERLEVYEGIDREFMQELLENALAHNIFYDGETTKKIIDEKINNLSLTRGKIQKDETIISRGDIVTEELYQEIVSLKREYERQLGGSSSYYMILGGQIILVSILLLVLLFFISIFRKDLIAVQNKVVFILILLTLTVCMTSISLNIEDINIYILPFCILPIIIRTFYDTRLATFTHVIAVVLIGFLAPNSFEFVCIQLIAGIVAVFSLVNLRKRSQLFTTSFIIFICYSITYLGFAIIQEGEFKSINWINLAWFGGSAALTLFAYPLMYAFEKVFGFLSDVSLMELSDTNSPLLRKLAEKAPGTLQHSLQVANLAEEAIRQIDGNTLLVRTGALYHDIGKMDNPMYFIENQSGNNPHDNLSYEESAVIIIGHVAKGVEMAKKAKLPEQVIEFIQTHHGNSLVGYFYTSYKNEHPDEEIDESLFRYPGPVPHSKETAVLMMADAVEAASRTLKTYDVETISDLVDHLIDGQTQQQQFVLSDITFRDITEIKKIFKKKLMNIYHLRVEYPE